MYSRNLSLGKLQLGALDALVVFVSVLIATWLRHGLGILGPSDSLGDVPWVDYLFPAALCSVTFVALFANSSLYESQPSRLVEAFALFRNCVVGTMAVLTLTFFYRGYSYSRATALLFVPTCFLALVLARHFYRIYSAAVLTREGAARRAIIVGCGPAGRRLAETLVHQPAYYRLLGFVSDPRDEVDQPLQVPVLGDLGGMARVIADHRVEEVLIAIPSAPREAVLAVLGECIRARAKWKIVPDLYELVLDRVHVDQVGGIPLIGLRGNSIVGFNWAMKRAFDLSFSTALVFLLSPLLVLIAAAVKASSRGPVLYRQVRVGHNGKPFEFLKFRSMYMENDASIHQRYTADWIYGHAERSAPGRPEERRVYKIQGDPRVTPIGRLLRKTSLDELPQFWNVLRGEMSVVGPRPPLPYEVERYTEWHKRRLDVLPGITGLWQVSGRNALSFEQMIRLDIQYIETWSLKKDLSIVWRTIPAVVLGKAY